MPAAGASISAPIGAVTSIPSCGRARWRIGWNRSRMKALVSHPLVGMIDGVAARRARFLESESYASFSDRTRILARRASASTSVRAARACWPPAPSALRLSRSDQVPAGPPIPAYRHGRAAGGDRGPGEQAQLLLALAEA